MQYQEFLDHIYQRYSGNVKLELSRMEGLLKDMQAPQDDLKGFHVAGTNGKGSVCATLEALSLASGWHTGLNTSPHLINYTERFRIDGTELKIQAIMDAFHRYEALFQKWDASFFEITTAIAFALFSQAKLDIAVMEVGLGGRLDATNLFTPDVTVITTIGLDHIKTLGGTVEIIASEKAGIIKKRIPLVLGDIDASPLAVIRKKADELNAPTYAYQLDWGVNTIEDGTAGICFDYHFGGYHFRGLKANLMGEHQATNIGTAITAYIVYCMEMDKPIVESTIRSGIANINWAGRMQVLRTDPTVIIDGAHNVHGVKALMNTLSKVYPNKKIRFVLSILADKDYSEMIKLFCAKAEKVYVAQNKSDRAATAEAQILEISKWITQAEAYPTVAEAYQAALNDSVPEDVIVAGGSLYTVGEVLTWHKDHA